MKRLFFALMFLFAACSDEFYNDKNDVKGSYDPVTRCVKISWDNDAIEAGADYQIVRKCHGSCEGVTSMVVAITPSYYNDEFENCYNHYSDGFQVPKNSALDEYFSLEYTILEDDNDRPLNLAFMGHFFGSYETPDIKRSTVAKDWWW